MSDSFDTTMTALRAAKGGDAQALGDLVSRYRVVVRKLVVRRMGPELRGEADTSEVVHDVLLAVLQGFDRFEIRGERALNRWLSRMVHNRVIDLVRHRRAQRLAGESQPLPDELPGHQPSPTANVGRDEERASIHKALAQLPEDERRVIELRTFEQVPYAEVARVLGRPSEEAAQMLHRRALIRLTRLLREGGVGGT